MTIDHEDNWYTVVDRVAGYNGFNSFTRASIDDHGELDYDEELGDDDTQARRQSVKPESKEDTAEQGEEGEEAPAAETLAKSEAKDGEDGEVVSFTFSFILYSVS